MSNEACQALREIESGRLEISDFAPPGVFTSGLFDRYWLTIADLRWHLTECDECGSSMTAAQEQLAAFDRVRFTAIGNALHSAHGALKCWAEWVKQESAFMAEDIVASLDPECQGGEAGARADLVDYWSQYILDENQDRLARAAIRLNASLGEPIARWLETLVSPAVPRISVLGNRDVITD